MDFPDILRVFREQKKMSQGELAHFTGIPQSRISNYENGKSKPDRDDLIQLAYALKRQISDFFPEQVPDVKRPASAFPAPSYIPNDIPVIGMAKAGRSGFFDDCGFPVGEGFRKVHRPDFIKDAHAYCLYVDGDSMYPIDHRWIVYCVTDQEPKSGDLVVIRTRDGEVMLKELVEKDGTVVLKSYNSSYNPIVLSKKDVVFMHKVELIKPR